jgi:beta-glucanase (GH16 family)
LAQTAASATSYTDTGLTDGTSYSYYVVAYDAAGNVSAPSATVSAAPSSTPLPVGVRGSWSLKFDDEFTGSSLDLSRWQPNWLAADNTSTTKPANSDQNNCESPAQASVGGGSLNLTLVAASCRANNGQTYPYASALVNTHNSFTYTRGYIEARVFLPSTNGICDNWPSFWADGVETSGVSWPTFGELDVMECLSDGLNYHFHSDAGGPGNVVKMADQGGWHILGADLEPGTQSCSGSAPDPVVATYYYDGAQVGTESACIASTGMYIILSNDISSAHGGPALVPATMQVDYVRAWQ